MLIGYDFSIEYIRTDDFGQADALSRLIQQCPLENEDVVVAAIEADVCAVVDTAVRHLPVTRADIEVESWRDPLLRSVMKLVKSGKWPELKNAPAAMKPFISKKNRLSVVNGVLMDEDRIVVPSIFYQEILKELHVGHIGMEKMRKLSRQFVYWPNMDKDICDYVSKCRLCVENSKSPVKVPLSPWPKPSGPWERIHIDFAGPVDDKYFFVAVDSFSKWPEVAIMNKITASNTVKILQEWFSRYGNPKVIVSDNGVQFTSSEFAKMCETYGIDHIRSPTYHPQSNGQAERFVDTLKRGLKKLKGEGKPSEESLRILLMAYRSAPCNAIEDSSPAELFLGRKLHCRLSLLRENSAKPGDLTAGAEKMKQQFDLKHGAKDRRYKIGDKIVFKRYIRNEFVWEEGEIIRPIGKVMFLVNGIDGKTSKVHMNQMKRSDMEAPNCQPTCMDSAELLWLDEMFNTFDLREQASSDDSSALPSLPDAVSLSMVPPMSPVVDASRVHQPVPVSTAQPRSVATSTSSSDAHVVPLRRSTRIRKPVIRFPDS